MNRLERTEIREHRRQLIISLNIINHSIKHLSLATLNIGTTKTEVYEIPILSS